MIVKMKQTTPGSPDGINIKKYLAGETYDLPENLASNFLVMGVADKVEGQMPTRKMAPAPLNKAVQPEKSKEAGESPSKKDEDSMDDLDDILDSGNVKKKK